MGEKGFSGFDKKEIGSVARYVKENAACNVVLVEGLPDDWADEDNLNFTEK